MVTVRQLPGLFPETLQKSILRARDGFLIQELAAKKSRRLSYTGLAGAHARDVLEWNDWLGYAVVVERPIADAVSRGDFETQVLLRLTPIFHGNVRIVFQDVWQYLASADFLSAPQAPDIVNLDFCGGFINQVDMEYPIQRAAFQALFEREQGDASDFLLLMTMMPRDRGKQTYKQFLREHFAVLRDYFTSAGRGAVATQLEDNRSFHERSNLTLFKACLPLLLVDIGRAYNYRVSTRYVRLYTKMIHLAFECAFSKGHLGLPPDPAHAVSLLNAPIRKLLEDGQEEQVWPPQIGLTPR